jgi:hypothetical protein
VLAAGLARRGVLALVDRGVADLLALLAAQATLGLAGQVVDPHRVPP